MRRRSIAQLRTASMRVSTPAATTIFTSVKKAVASSGGGGGVSMAVAAMSPVGDDIVRDRLEELALDT